MDKVVWKVAVAVWSFVMFLFLMMVFAVSAKADVTRDVQISGVLPDARIDGSSLPADEIAAVRVEALYCNGDTAVIEGAGFPLVDTITVPSLPCEIAYRVSVVDTLGLQSDSVSRGTAIDVSPPNPPREITVTVTVVVQ